MYLKKINIQNYGPLKHFILDMPFNKDENGNKTTPKPLIIVGQNGTGKTIILSHIVNSLLLAKQKVYPDCEVKRDFVYKVRSPLYIQNAFFSYARLDFSDNNYVFEYVLQGTKKIVETNPDFVKPASNDWDVLCPDDSSTINTSFSNDKTKTKKLLDEGVLKYFPSDRTSTPAWLNASVLIKQQEYLKQEHFTNVSNRKIVYNDEFEDNKSWFMNIILDRELYERSTKLYPFTVTRENGTVSDLHFVPAYSGQATVLHQEILKIVRAIFKKYDTNVRLGVGDRHNRHLGIFRTDDNQQLLPNLSQLSLGESLLLNLFISIVRDADMGGMLFTSLSDVSGIVLIDEIETHLHNDLIAETLPELIKLFPKIQFIITSHSPIFLLGMEKTFDNNIQIIELDSNAKNGFFNKSAEEFSEFQSAFDLYSHTSTFEQKIAQVNIPVVLTEGETDEKIISKAWSELYPDKEKPFCVMGLNAKTGSGASAIKAMLQKLRSFPDKKIIGVFDSDKMGLDALKTLVDRGLFEKRKDDDIWVKGETLFATCLPVPENKKALLRRDEGFEIEDYFPDEVLGENGSNRINGYIDEHGDEIVDENKPMCKKFTNNDKTGFAEQVQSYDNKDGKFNNFQLLFDRILKICKI